jgi:CheY-like chemotaxis protein
MVNILLVDDDYPTNMLHQFVLKRVNLFKQVEVAETAIDALAILEKGNFQPNIIFLDINMPAMNGFEFIEALRNTAIEIPPIVLLTTSHNPADQEKAKTYNEIKLYQNKPLNVQMVQDIYKQFF